MQLHCLLCVSLSTSYMEWLCLHRCNDLLCSHFFPMSLTLTLLPNFDPRFPVFQSDSGILLLDSSFASLSRLMIYLTWPYLLSSLHSLPAFWPLTLVWRHWVFYSWGQSLNLLNRNVMYIQESAHFMNSVHFHKYTYETRTLTKKHTTTGIPVHPLCTFPVIIFHTPRDCCHSVLFLISCWWLMTSWERSEDRKWSKWQRRRIF